MITLFTNATVVTMDDAQPVMYNAYVAVKDDFITYVGWEKPQLEADSVIDCTGKVMMPGFVNAHSHLPMTLMRGYGGGHDLQHWLNDFIFPAEDKLDGRCVRAGTGLALADLIANGVTTVADMYYFTDDVIHMVVQSGLNANICRSVSIFEDTDRPEDYYSCVEMRKVVEDWHGYNNGQILMGVSIHGEYTSYACPEIWRYLGDYAGRYNLGMQVHVSETKQEHEECMARHGGRTPMKVLDDYGVWQNGGCAAHCVWVTPEDRQIMLSRGITCVHNPVSNLKLGSGIAPIPTMLREGINVALGTDGVASNNSFDMFEEMKLAAMLHTVDAHDPNVIPARQALKMATVNGAKAMDRNTGVIAAGKLADLILLDFNKPSLTPCHDVEENLVFSARGSDVCLTMARGRILYENGQFTTLDVPHIMEEFRSYALPHMFG